MTTQIALVQPSFPNKSKSKNNHRAVPIGLIKIAPWMKSKGIDARLFQNGTLPPENWIPDEVWITTMFTYWSQYVNNSYIMYKTLYPKATFKIGGILPSLAPKFCKTTFDPATIHQGLIHEAEEFPADYSLLVDPPDLQIMFASRGCIRKCKFCYTWRIEGNIHSISIPFIIKNIHKPRVIFYDNNFLANPKIDELLRRLTKVRIKSFESTKPKIIRPRFECQSGFDGRLLQKRPELAIALKKANFRFPRIAWDGPITDAPDIRKQLDIIEKAKFRKNETQVFMLFNHDIPPEELDEKRRICWDWQIQIIDCRFRPLDQFHDDFNSRREQTHKDYHIHIGSGWTDKKIKTFRRMIRRQNICVRYKFPWHSKHWERKKLRQALPDNILHRYKHEPSNVVRATKWFSEATFPEEPLYT